MKILFPVRKGNITQKFGENVAFYQQRFGVNGHQGTDIVSFHGDSLYCPEDGVIVRAYDSNSGSITAGFGLWVLGNPDENGICLVHILWHTMSNLKCQYNQEVKKGEVLAYEGDSGAVYVNMLPVADVDKGKGSFPGTHLHWGNIKVKKVNVPSLQSLTDLNRIAFEHNGFFYDVLNQDNGFHGCTDPMLSEIIQYDEWLLEQTKKVGEQIVVALPNMSPEQVGLTLSWFERLVNKLKDYFGIK